jgi:hypothetical protein
MKTTTFYIDPLARPDLVAPGKRSQQTTLTGTAFAWSQQVLWGDKALGDDDLMSPKQVLWDD